MSIDDQKSFADRMMAEARTLRAAAEAAWLPAVRGQLMSRVIEYENAAASDAMSDAAALKARGGVV